MGSERLEQGTFMKKVTFVVITFALCNLSFIAGQLYCETKHVKHTLGHTMPTPTVERSVNTKAVQEGVPRVIQVGSFEWWQYLERDEQLFYMFQLKREEVQLLNRLVIAMENQPQPPQVSRDQIQLPRIDQQIFHELDLRFADMVQKIENFEYSEKNKVADINMPTTIEAEKGTESNTHEQIDINTVGLAELCTLPGIGPSRAAWLIAERTLNGPFSSLQDPRLVNRIGRDRMKDLANMIVTSVITDPIQ